MNSIILFEITLLVVIQQALGIFGEKGRSANPCPNDFLRIYNKCYYFSHEYETWERANWKCQERNSTLAVIMNKNQNTALREFLRKGYLGAKALSTTRIQTHIPRWMGGQFDWKSSKWIWIYNAKPIRYNQFDSDSIKNKSLAWHCLILDPNNEFKWNSTSCFDKYYYLCQTHSTTRNPQQTNQANLNQNNSDNNRLNNTEQHDTLPGYIEPKIFEATGDDRDRRKKPRKRFVCPKNFIRVGKKCYSLSRDKQTWSNAYYNCQDIKSELAVFKNMKQDKKLRTKLRKLDIVSEKRWMGGYFDFKNSLWKWAATGKLLPVKPQAAGDLKWSCLLWDPNLHDKWTSESCMVQLYYMCQSNATVEERKSRLRKQKKVRTI